MATDVLKVAEARSEAQRRLARFSTASFKGERGDATIRVPREFKVRPGAQLADACFIGRELGSGIQVLYRFIDNNVSLPFTKQMAHDVQRRYTE
jgi:hypothetical protein